MEVTSGFKGRDLIDRVPEELWMEVHDILKEALIKTIPKKKKCKKAKLLSEEDLQIAEKRREVKGKGEKVIYTHLNAESQRIAALFIMASNWKQPRCPSRGKWINQLLYIHTVEFYSATKRTNYR